MSYVIKGEKGKKKKKVQSAFEQVDIRGKQTARPCRLSREWLEESRVVHQSDQ